MDLSDSVLITVDVSQCITSSACAYTHTPVRFFFKWGAYQQFWDLSSDFGAYPLFWQAAAVVERLCGAEAAVTLALQRGVFSAALAVAVCARPPLLSEQGTI